jgi:hypothetical protein
VAVITKVYGGRALISFNSGKHYYTVSAPEAGISKLYQPGVTSIIGKLDKSGPLVHWAVNQMGLRLKQLIGAEEAVDRNMLEALIEIAQDSYREVKEEAGGIGSLVHRVLEEKLQGGEPKLPIVADPLLAPNLTPEMVESANLRATVALAFIAEHDIKVVQVEQPRWSPTYGYIGTGDLIAEIDGKLSALDWKNGKRLYPTVFLQLAAYQQAYEEEYQRLIEQRVAVNVNREGELTHETRDNSTFWSDMKAFLALLEVWRWDRPNEWPAGTKEAPPLLTQEQRNRVVYASV